MDKTQPVKTSGGFLRRLANRISFKLSGMALKRKDAQSVFTDIYDRGGWAGSDETVSGAGSNLENTSVLRDELVKLFDELEIKSMLDIPCGDFNWMKEIPLDGVDYIGADIVADMIDDISKKYSKSGISFRHLDLISDTLPDADLVFVRDCMIHLSDVDATKSLKNICRTKSKYLLATTFPTRGKNRDIATGQWRPIDLQASPFNLPEPIKMLEDNRKFQPDKSMGLWLIDDIRRIVNA